MLSRVAECIYWMNRYIERAESVARFVDVNLNLTLDLGDNLTEQWQPLVFTTGDQDQFFKHYGVATQRNVVEFLTFDERNPNSILSCLRAARENGRTVREIISSPMWEEINKFYLMVRSAKGGKLVWEAPYNFFNEVKLSSHKFVGITDATMSHDEAWHFARLARLLERADKTSRILDVKYYLLLPSAADVGTPLDTIQWSALLKSASALEMYRQRRGRITPHDVADFLILDREFPRAMHFCLIKAGESLQAISAGLNGDVGTSASALLNRMRAEMLLANIDDIIGQGLHEFVDDFQIKLNKVGAAVHATFFAPGPAEVTVQRQEQSQ